MKTIDEFELECFLSGYWLSDLANFSAYLFEALEDINWLGFYLDDGERLRLGPFAGKPACLEIAYAKGVCGTAYSENKILRVDDVDTFPGHIRCDIRSKSEIVLPLVIHGKLVGVLDVDSPSKGRFNEHDQKQLESALKVLTKKIQSYPRGKFGEI